MKIRHIMAEEQTSMGIDGSLTRIKTVLSGSDRMPKEGE